MVMKRFFLFFTILANMNVLGNDIIYKYENSIFLYNIEKKETVKLIDCDTYFSIGSISYNDDSISFILYNDIEFAASSSKRIIYEQEYLIKERKCILLSNNKVTLFNENDKITLKDDKFYLESVSVNGMKSLSVINSYNDLLKRYYNHSDYKSDANVNHNWEYILENGDWNFVFKSAKDSDGISCEYYEPDMSPDGIHLSFIYQCSKHNRKKVIETKLFEVNIQDKTIKDLSFLSGSSPKYSQDSRYILYRRYKRLGFAIYDRNNGTIYMLDDVQEAYWIKL
jgi:hypothetical protein